MTSLGDDGPGITLYRDRWSYGHTGGTTAQSARPPLSTFAGA